MVQERCAGLRRDALQEKLSDYVEMLWCKRRFLVLLNCSGSGKCFGSSEVIWSKGECSGLREVLWYQLVSRLTCKQEV